MLYRNVPPVCRTADGALGKRAALGVYSLRVPHRMCQGPSAAWGERAGAAGERAACLLAMRTPRWLPPVIHGSYAGADPVGSAAQRAVQCGQTGHVCRLGHRATVAEAPGRRGGLEPWIPPRFPRLMPLATCLPGSIAPR